MHNDLLEHLTKLRELTSKLKLNGGLANATASLANLSRVAQYHAFPSFALALDPSPFGDDALQASRSGASTLLVNLHRGLLAEGRAAD